MNEFNRSRRILDLRMAMDHRAMMQILDELATRYHNLSIGTIGQSILGREIPLVRLGARSSEGQESHRVLYIGTHHGMEWITTALLLRFINEYCELLKSDGMAEGIRVSRVDSLCGIYIVPMLNPDGVEYSLHGVDEDHILYSRLLGMNGGSCDFSHWQANARGVDLNHNYNAGFSEYKKLEAANQIPMGAPTRYSGEAPESEPETAYLCNYLRFNNPFCGALTLHTQGEEIYYSDGDTVTPRTERLASYLAGISGYRAAKPEGLAAYGGFTDWFGREFHRPSFTFECGKGENPLPISAMPPMYLRMRKVLFEFPMLV